MPQNKYANICTLFVTGGTHYCLVSFCLETKTITLLSSQFHHLFLGTFLNYVAQSQIVQKVVNFYFFPFFNVFIWTTCQY
jgi:hypothetical protein